MTAAIVIREIQAAEFACIWPIFQVVIARGDTYPYPSDLGFEVARGMWTTPPARCFIAEADGQVLGCYRIAPNQVGRGDHVANGSYMVAPGARGRGVGAALCEHSLDEARRSGFIAMQFNMVVSTNETAVRLWQRHGFRIIGQVPGGFRHAVHGLIDTYVMHRML
ncbi:MAG TPA: GNAT family N-acetyltransferase [Lysobacter sp.]